MTKEKKMEISLYDFDKEEYERLAGLINPAKRQLLLLLSLIESKEKANTMLVEQND